MLFKIEEFINNLEKNDDVLNFFNSSEIFNSNKPLELKKKFDDYIDKLKKRENESEEKAIKAMFCSSGISIP